MKTRQEKLSDRLSVGFSEFGRLRLKAIAMVEGISEADAIRRAVDQYPLEEREEVKKILLEVLCQ